MPSESTFESKLKALQLALDKAKQLEAFVAKDRKIHGVYQVAMARGVAKGLEDALHIMTSETRAKKVAS